jgi:cyclopropane-fatty-acyl-phospholipid synthase
MQALLASADVQIGGSRPWDIQVYREDFYPRVLKMGSLGLGESYMDGWWDSLRLDEFIHRILLARLDSNFIRWVDRLDSLKTILFNLQSPSRALQVGQRHYDMGNRLFSLMLDKRLIYSCGYWKNASTLGEAQEAKLDLVCQKLGLRPGMRVLDIGCGWGGAARFVAERYQVEVVGITISQEQFQFATELCRGLPVEIRLQDYRDLAERFDRIYSIGMFEHVGYKNYAHYMRIAHNCLKEDGLFLLHTIGSDRSVTKANPWMARYIFPNSMLPSPKQICTAIEGLFVLEDWHNFGADYDKTLMQWFQNFHDHWDTLKTHYDERFYRMWKYYLLSCAGSFRAREAQVWQIVLAPRGVMGGYRSFR